MCYVGTWPMLSLLIALIQESRLNLAHYYTSMAHYASIKLYSADLFVLSTRLACVIYRVGSQRCQTLASEGSLD